MNKIRKLYLGLGLLAGASLSPCAFADLAADFADMTGATTTTNAPRTFNSIGRSGVDFGGGKIVTGASSRSIQLVNFTPPKLHAGCGGIDYHLGGISWITWDQFEAILDNVVMAAEYAVVNLALDFVSEKLGNTFKTVMNAIMKATQMEKDACALGRELATAMQAQLGDMFSEKKPPSNDEQSTNECEHSAVMNGTAESNSDAYAQQCGGFMDKVKALSESWSLNEGWNQLIGMIRPDGTAVEASNSADSHPPTMARFGNLTWNALAGMGFNKAVFDPPGSPGATGAKEAELEASVALSELLMSATGYQFASGDACKDNPSCTEEWLKLYQNGVTYSPTLQPAAVATILICGTDYFLKNSKSESTNEALGAAGTAANEVKDAATSATQRAIDAVCQKLAVPGEMEKSIKIVTCLDKSQVSSLAPTADSAPVEAPQSMFDALSGGLTWSAGAKSTCLYPAALPAKNWADQGYVKRFIGKGLLPLTLERMNSIFAKLATGSEALSNEEYAFLASVPYPIYRTLSLAALFPGSGATIVSSHAQMTAALMAQAMLDKIVADAGKNATPKMSVTRQEIELIRGVLERIYNAFGDEQLNVNAFQDRLLAANRQSEIMYAAVMDSVYGRGLMGNLEFGVHMASTGGPGAPAAP